MGGEPTARSRLRETAPRPVAPAGIVGDHANAGYRSTTWQARLFAMVNTALIWLVVLFAAFFTWRDRQTPMPPTPPLMLFTPEPLAAPPEPVHEVPDGPQQVVQVAQRQREVPPKPQQIALPKFDRPTVPPTVPVQQTHPADPVPETTAPKSLPAPPARYMTSDADASWEALLLAHLERYRRYPANARGEQGVTYVTVRMERSGRVLTAAITRSSGSARLDRAALDTIYRAQPLPAIPDDRPDVLSLSVPVEFFVW